LGADISAIQINPAGMGRFSSSRASISFNNSIIRSNGKYNGVLTKARHNKFAISSAGVVFSKDLSEENIGRKYSQFTIGYTRLKNFSNSRHYEGQNFYSLLDVFANSGRGISPELIYDLRPFTTGLAYDVFALDYNSSNQQYQSRLTNGDMYHTRDIETDGGMGEFHIGYSENYMNTFYYGASLGIRRINYEKGYTHHERLLDTVGTTLRSFTYKYDQTTSGTGLNLKLGVMYLPNNNFRFGISFESPSIIVLEDEWTADMTATHVDGLKYVEPEYVPTGKYEYTIKTPMKLRGSIAYILGMRGAINVDLELSRLPGGKLRPSNSLENPNNAYQFEIENKEVKNQFRTVLNTRIGIEYMIVRDFYLRGGIAILPQPYKKGVVDETTVNQTYSAGIGWENKYFSIDLSYRLMRRYSEYYAFDPSKLENRATFRVDQHNIVLTGRIKF